MSDLLAAIRERRRLHAGQALALLDAVPSSDTETKQSLLSMAGRYLADRAVLGRWLELVADETDSALKEAMLARVAHCDQRVIPDMGAYIRLMASSLAAPRLRPHALAALNRLVTAFPEVVDVLVEAYGAQTSAQVRRDILLGLSRCSVLPPRLLDFLMAEAQRCDADVKLVLVDRLLRRDAVDPPMLERWLATTEPSDVKERVLQHLLDRSILLEAATIGVLRSERRPPLRLLALRALVAQAPASGEAIQAILDALRDDPDPQVRAEAVLAFGHAVQPAPEILSALLQTLRTEKARDVAQLILDGLIPYAGSMPAVRDGLMALARENLHVEVAAALYAALGRLLRWDADLLPDLLAAYEGAPDDRSRSLLLEALSLWPDPNERPIALYRDALRAPDSRIRQWGVQGLLRVPMTEDQAPVVAAGVASLLDASIDLQLRRLLAAKIGRIPDPPPDLRAALEETAEHSEDEDIRRACRVALARSPSAAPGPGVDLARWYHQAAVEHSVQGIFPEVYMLYDASPEECARILKVAVLDPACRDALYNNDFPVSANTILQFLLSHDALDDDLCRYCVEQAQTSPGPAFYIGMLRSRPALPELRGAVWHMIESTARSSASSRMLLLELMILVHGSETTVAAMLRERLLQLRQPVAAIPFLRFLDANRSWPPVGPLLEELLTATSLLDADNLAILRDALRELFPERTPESRGPGLADD
jgi:hypothetical protein